MVCCFIWCRLRWQGISQCALLRHKSPIAIQASLRRRSPRSPRRLHRLFPDTSFKLPSPLIVHECSTRWAAVSQRRTTSSGDLLRNNGLVRLSALHGLRLGLGGQGRRPELLADQSHTGVCTGDVTGIQNCLDGWAPGTCSST